MSTSTSHGPSTEIEELVYEIARYLAAVDLFRSEGREPWWQPEWADQAVLLERSLSDRREHRIVH